MDAVCEDMATCLSKHEPRFLACSTDMIVSPPMVMNILSINDLYLGGTMGRNFVFELSCLVVYLVFAFACSCLQVLHLGFALVLSYFLS